MVLCIAGIIIFGILGIFSGKYRRYFKLSMHCLSRQMTLRPCDTNFDQELRAKISTGLGKKSPALGRLVFRRYKTLSWLFVALMVLSIIFMGIGVYNYVLYNNCNGPNSNDFCIFNVFDGTADITKLHPVGTDDDPTLGNISAPVKIVEVGCFSCPFTRAAEPLRKQLLEKYGNNVSFTFRTLPIPTHNMSWERAEAADCALEQGKYWEYHDKLFEYQDNFTVEKIAAIAQEIGLDTTQFNQCYTTHKYYSEVKKDYDDAVGANIFATPTYFINGKPYVGPKSLAQFENLNIGDITGTCEQ